MAEEKEGEIAEEALMGLGGDAAGLGGGAMGLGGEDGPPQPPVLTDEQIIACAVIGAETGNATAEELRALRGKRPDLAAVISIGAC